MQAAITSTTALASKFENLVVKFEAILIAHNHLRISAVDLIYGKERNCYSEDSECVDIVLRVDGCSDVLLDRYLVAETKSGSGTGRDWGLHYQNPGSSLPQPRVITVRPTKTVGVYSTSYQNRGFAQ